MTPRVLWVVLVKQSPPLCYGYPQPTLKQAHRLASEARIVYRCEVVRIVPYVPWRARASKTKTKIARRARRMTAHE